MTDRTKIERISIWPTNGRSAGVRPTSRSKHLIHIAFYNVDDEPISDCIIGIKYLGDIEQSIRDVINRAEKID